MQPNDLRMSVYASLMAALIAVGAYLVVPVGPVPVVLQNLFVLLAGLLLGGRWGLASVGIYLLVGAVGLPVFAEGKGGIAHLLGPRGGYLFGFAAAAAVAGMISERGRSRMSVDAVAVVIGTLLVYACGVPWLKVQTGMSWEKALAVGMAPFVIPDAVKAAAAVVLARSLRPVMKRRLGPGVS
ncbi:MAG: biotin transporter BioY [Syntrophobacteraceae bacterium]